jgi:hypothetical protein
MPITVSKVVKSQRGSLHQCGILQEVERALPSLVVLSDDQQLLARRSFVTAGGVT